MSSSLISLPFRLVVSKILPFHLVREKEVKNEFGFFGYFNNDSFRNIFFVFSSMCVDRGFFRSSKNFADVSKIIYLEYFQPTLKGLRSFINLSDKFSSLTSLSVLEHREFNPRYENFDNDESILFNFKDIFSKKNCFPRLKYLYLSSDFGLDPVLWSHANHLWENLETFIWSGKLISASLCHEYFKTCLQKIRNVEFTNCFHKLPDKNVCVNIQGAKKIVLGGEQNYIGGFMTGNMLQIVHLYGYFPPKSVQLLLASQNLTQIVYSPSDQTNGSVLFSKMVNFQNLQLLDISDVIIPRKIELGSRISHLSIKRCENTDNILKFLTPEKHFRLSTLNLNRISETFGEEELALVNMVTKLEFKYLLNLRTLFQSNTKCDNLEELRLKFTFLKGEDWEFPKCFPKLRKMILYLENIGNTYDLYGYDIDNFDTIPRIETEYHMDSLFSEKGRFPSLEELEIVSRGKEVLIGKDWDRTMTDNLKKLKLAFSIYLEWKKRVIFDGCVFQEHSFPNLEKLSLIGIKEQNEENWKGLKNVKKLHIEYCCSDKVLQNTNILNNLEELRIKSCKKVRGKEWNLKEKTKLKLIDILVHRNHKDVSFTVGGEKKKPFGEDIIFKYEKK